MTIQQFDLSTSANRVEVQARSSFGEHDKSAQDPTLGLALAQLAEAIQTAKRAGVTSAQMQIHLSVLWPVVPVEDVDV